MFAELIGAGATLLGGLFGKKKKETTTTNQIDYVKMAQNAEAAGFNPLTAMRNGGGAGFTSSTVSHLGLSGVADAVGQIGGALGSALDSKLDPMARKQREVESALLDYQLQTIQSKPKASMMFGDVPTRSGRNVVATPKAALSSGTKAAPVVAGRLLSSQSNGGWLDPPKPADADMSLWVAAKDRDGKRTWVPNPDLPDADQYLVPFLSRTGRGLEGAADSLMNWRQHTSVRNLNEAEKKKQEESWLPSWVPRISFDPDRRIKTTW